VDNFKIFISWRSDLAVHEVCTWQVQLVSDINVCILHCTGLTDCVDLGVSKQVFFRRLQMM